MDLQRGAARERRLGREAHPRLQRPVDDVAFQKPLLAGQALGQHPSRYRRQLGDAFGADRFPFCNTQVDSMEMDF